MVMTTGVLRSYFPALLFVKNNNFWREKKCGGVNF